MSEEKTYQPRLKTRYEASIRQKLQKEFKYKNVMQIPGIEKVIVSIGAGELVQDSKKLPGILEDLALITGQKPIATRAKKSLAGFKLREGMPIGAKVTLRGNRMYEFLDRLMNIALPRAKDFRGLKSKSFDGFGNYALGIKEHIIFPEINYDTVDKVRGMNIVVQTSAKTDKEAKVLLAEFDFPFIN